MQLERSSNSSSLFPASRISGYTLLIEPDLAEDSQLPITMEWGDECPYVPGLKRDDCS